MKGFLCLLFYYFIFLSKLVYGNTLENGINPEINNVEFPGQESNSSLLVVREANPGDVINTGDIDNQVIYNIDRPTFLGDDDNIIPASESEGIATTTGVGSITVAADSHDDKNTKDVTEEGTVVQNGGPGYSILSKNDTYFPETAGEKTTIEGTSSKNESKSAKVKKQVIVNIENKVYPNFNIHLERGHGEPKFECDDDGSGSYKNKTINCKIVKIECCRKNDVNCVCNATHEELSKIQTTIKSFKKTTKHITTRRTTTRKPTTRKPTTRKPTTRKPKTTKKPTTTEPTTESTTEPTTESTTEPTTESTTEPTTEPTTESTTEPTTEPTTEESTVHDETKRTKKPRTKKPRTGNPMPFKKTHKPHKKNDALLKCYAECDHKYNQCAEFIQKYLRRFNIHQKH